MDTHRQTSQIITYSVGLWSCAVSCLVAFGCQKQTHASKNTPSKPIVTAPAVSTSKVAPTQSAPKKQPKVVYFEPPRQNLSTKKRHDPELGEVHEQRIDLTWEDAKGKNQFVFLQTRWPSDRHKLAASLIMTHKVRTAKQPWRVVRTYKERLQPCDKDANAHIMMHKPVVTDLDKNHIKEITWAYHVGCRPRAAVVEGGDDLKPPAFTQASAPTQPITHKVLMAEFGQKYAIRGKTVVPTKDAQFRGASCEVSREHGGSKRIDPALYKAPAGFLEHAKQVWHATVTEAVECQIIDPG